MALFFDSIADIADDVGELIGRSRDYGLNIACIAVDNREREAAILGKIETAFLLHRRMVTINSKMTGTDARRLVDKLQSIGRLGFLETQNRDVRRIAHFRNKELFDAMAQLENAPGFGRRVSDLIEAIESPKHLEIAFIAALAYRFGRRIYAIDVGRMVAMESDAVVRAVIHDPHLSAVLKTDGQWVNTRHRWMALDSCVNHIGEGAALKSLGMAMRRVAPRLGRASQRERNSTSLLIGSFMTYNNLRQVFPSSDLAPWYTELLPVFGDWSARYWEQRAIMSRHVGRSEPIVLSQAESYALRAVSIVRDAFSLTTLGTVLLAKAAYSPQVDVGEYYDRAIDAYEEAGQCDPRDIVPWMAFLRNSIDVLVRAQETTGNDGSDIEERLKDDWLRIHAQISNIASAGDLTKEDLATLMRRYRATREFAG